MKILIRKITILTLIVLFCLSGCEKKTPIGHEEIIPPSYNGDAYPDWSPDGLAIAFTHITVPGDTSGGPFDIYFINSDGSNRRLFLLGAHSPDWSPDGSKLAFVLGGQICIINRDGTGFKSLEVEGFFPDWSPDSLTIAYDIGEGGHTYFVNVNRPGQSQKHMDNAWAPNWSPDGQYLAFSRLENPYVASSIYIAKVDGSNALQLAKPIDRLDFHYFPCYSHDSSKIAYSSSKRGIIIMNKDGTTKKTIYPLGNHPTWSPDDRHIVFGGSTSIPARFRLFIAEVNGMGIRQLTFY
ncbi:MAG: Protein TolB [bacterium]|nr:Protein TolB [bacterium]